MSSIGTLSKLNNAILEALLTDYVSVVSQLTGDEKEVIATRIMDKAKELLKLEDAKTNQ